MSPAIGGAWSGFAIAPTGGELIHHVVHFARLLRRAGLVIGAGQVLEAARAVAVIDVTVRDDFRAALRTTLLTDRRDAELFDQAFSLYWRDPRRLEHILSELLPKVRAPYEERRKDIARRLDEALAAKDPARPEARSGALESEDTAFDAAMSYAPREVLRHKDFEQMSVAEMRSAREAIARLRPRLAEVVTRRYRPDMRGPRVDMRATLRAAIAAGGEWLPLRRRAKKKLPPPVVVLCDISGSMERYSRIFLHFMHALLAEWRRAHAFVFGTRLTDITRDLAQRDVDRALAAAGTRARDWAGGTRIGACLAEFNRQWARRVLGQGAIVLLVTDGLDRDGAAGIGEEMARLGRSCRRLVWLNPLLRYTGFEPRAAGIRAMLPYVDEHRPVHNLASLEDLARALSDLGRSGARSNGQIRGRQGP